jgi:flavin reductase (DIM6/NTAB) family NADH-FMN oxidoreductase RutF
MTTPTGPDLDTMKQVNRQFITGVTVVTAMDDKKPRGLAVNAFSSVSLDPPTVMVAVQRTSSTHECLFRAEHLAINILSTDQLDVVGVFATKAADKFAGLDWEPGPYGSPLIRRQWCTNGSRDPRAAAGQHPRPVRLPHGARHGQRSPRHGLQRP